MMCVIDSDNICGGGGGDTPPPLPKGRDPCLSPREENALIGPQITEKESLIDACIVITSQIKEGGGLTPSVLLLLLAPINFSWRPSRGAQIKKIQKM